MDRKTPDFAGYFAHVRDVWIKRSSSQYCCDEQKGPRRNRPIGFTILVASLRIELEEKDRQLELKDWQMGFIHATS